MTTAPSGAPAPVRLLLVEDDELIRHSFAGNLERYGYEVTEAADGLEGLELFRAAADAPHDLLLLDVMLPGLDGIGLCRRIRETSTVPILMMSARGDGLDVVSGLEAGADDYIVKPVETHVLLARIRSALRRASWHPAPDPGRSDPGEPDTLLTFGDLTVDTAGMTVTLAGAPVALTPTELRLVLEFAARPEVVVDRHTLLREVWDHGWDADTRVVDLAVQRLRKKIGPHHLETVRGFGYKFRR
ncbi:two-component system response regulator CseB (plasmid) [Streptomyces sp. BI20]|uniref:two-component system response regulator CseB n=1 Tax=Streptomyces sp. BI20 TaxID=3403460 RepID=UPI003C71B8C8